MDKFIEFEGEVTLEALQESLSRHNPGIVLLRVSRLTGTVKIRTEKKLSKRELKRAFRPHKIRKVYDDFPLHGGKH